MYSRHPDPRRVWKGGSEQHLLTPLPRAPGANAKKLYVAVFYDVFEKCLFLFSVKGYMLLCFTMILAQSLFLFLVKSYMLLCFTMIFVHLLVPFFMKSRRRPKAVQGSQRDPQDGQRDRKRGPMGAQRRPKGSQRHPRRPQGVPQVLRNGEVEPKGIPKGAKGSPRMFRSNPMAPKRHPREASGALYICKLPINRPSGRYVIIEIIRMM